MARERPVLSVSIPEAMLERIDVVAKRLGKTRSATVEQLVGHGLGLLEHVDETKKANLLAQQRAVERGRPSRKVKS